MLNSIVSIINKSANISSLAHSKVFPISLLLCEGPKTCLNMEREVAISHDTLQRILSSGSRTIDELKSFLISLIPKESKVGVTTRLIVDDSALAKQFAQVFEGLSFVHDSCSKYPIKGYKIVLICWSNGEITLPIDFSFWLPESLSNNMYRTKLDIARGMVAKISKCIKFDAILLDGLYASEGMMDFFEKNKITYYMRLPRSRTVRATESSIAFKIGDSVEYKLKKNCKSRTQEGFFGNTKRYITAQKRIRRNGEYETVYIVSNKKNNPRETIVIYSTRWAIEKLFRTLKQTLGVNDCQARTLEKQTIHILSCMAAYSILENIKIRKAMRCPEDAKRYLIDIKREHIVYGNQDLVNIFV